MTIAKNTRGMICKDSCRIAYGAITIRAKSDRMGESISLAYDDILLMVPYTEIEKAMKEARKERER